MSGRDAHQHGKMTVIKLKYVERFKGAEKIFPRVLRKVSKRSAPSRIVVRRCSKETSLRFTRLIESTFEVEIPWRLGKHSISERFD